MPVLMIEKRKSRPATVDVDKSASHAALRYTALGSKDDTEIHNACLLTLPPTFQGGFLQRYTIDHAGGGVWMVEAEYSPKEPLASTYTFETTATSQHITISKETVDTKLIPVAGDPAGLAVPDFKGLIGVNGDSVEGVDIKKATFSFSETHYIHKDLVTAAYKLVLFNATGKVNDALWHGLTQRECLFLGAQGSIRGSDYWEVSFKFECEPSKEDVPISNTGQTMDFKFGWDYMWIRYREDKHDASKTFVRTPHAVFLERVYDETSLLDLGIGT